MTHEEWKTLKEFLEEHKIPYKLQCISMSGWLGSDYVIILPTVHYNGTEDNTKYCPNCGAKMDEEVSE